MAELGGIWGKKKKEGAWRRLSEAGNYGSFIKPWTPKPRWLGLIGNTLLSRARINSRLTTHYYSHGPVSITVSQNTKSQGKSRLARLGIKRIERENKKASCIGAKMEGNRGYGNRGLDDKWTRKRSAEIKWKGIVKRGFVWNRLPISQILLWLVLSQTEQDYTAIFCRLCLDEVTSENFI